MGRKNKKYSQTLHQQAHTKLVGMQAFGESKSAAKLDGTYQHKIFSYATYQSYWKHIKYFLKWTKNVHPDCTTLRSAKKHVNTWLALRAEQGLSAWTICLEVQALNKLFGIPGDSPDRFRSPPRHRADIKRSRGEAVRDRHFSEEKNAEFVAFAKGCGARRNVLQKLEGRDLWTRAQMRNEVSKLESQPHLSDKERLHLKALRDALKFFPDDYFVHHRQDKGGKFRFAPLLPEYRAQIIARFRNTSPQQKVWDRVPGAADIHSYRADYAVSLYKQCARKISEISNRAEIYHCRRDAAGKHLDRKAMLRVSHALGHSRVDVIAGNYLHNL